MRSRAWALSALQVALVLGVCLWIFVAGRLTAPAGPGMRQLPLVGTLATRWDLHVTRRGESQILSGLFQFPITDTQNMAFAGLLTSSALQATWTGATALFARVRRYSQL